MFDELAFEKDHCERKGLIYGIEIERLLPHWELKQYLDFIAGQAGT